MLLNRCQVAGVGVGAGVSGGEVVVEAAEIAVVVGRRSVAVKVASGVGVAEGWGAIVVAGAAEGDRVDGKLVEFD